MNVFTTDHPMVSQPSCADAKAHRRLSALGDALALALALTPFALMLAVYWLLKDDDYVETTPDVPPGGFDLLGILAMGAGLAFVASYLCSLLIVLGYRFVAGRREVERLSASRLR